MEGSGRADGEGRAALDETRSRLDGADGLLTAEVAQQTRESFLYRVIAVPESDAPGRRPCAARTSAPARCKPRPRRSYLPGPWRSDGRPTAARADRRTFPSYRAAFRSGHISGPCS